METVDYEHKLAVEYVMNEQVNEMKALAIIAGSCKAMGTKQFSRVFIDYMMKCAPNKDYMQFLQDVVNDQGALNV